MENTNNIMWHPMKFFSFSTFHHLLTKTKVHTCAEVLVIRVLITPIQGALIHSLSQVW